MKKLNEIPFITSTTFSKEVDHGKSLTRFLAKLEQDSQKTDHKRVGFFYKNKIKLQLIIMLSNYN